ncbi:uncharacterized protein LOC124118184 [Haliotis rufescens]|uniref:uncharacterized protein LOC124118184 n=1 Tax=Haliotis rufescens TaxID=6454 RepID=UPI001EAF9DDF|nr:uncharacterized protein LOC124118184 [Haliotis rufescens]
MYVSHKKMACHGIFTLCFFYTCYWISPSLCATTEALSPLCESGESDLCVLIPSELCPVEVISDLCPVTCGECGDVDRCSRPELQICQVFTSDTFSGLCSEPLVGETLCPTACGNCDATPGPGGPGDPCALSCGADEILDDTTCTCVPATANCAVIDQPFCPILANNAAYADLCDNPIMGIQLCPAACGRCDKCESADFYICPVIEADLDRYCAFEGVRDLLCPETCGQCGADATTPDPCDVTCADSETLNSDTCTCVAENPICTFLIGNNLCEALPFYASVCPGCP